MATSRLNLNVYDGTRQPFPATTPVLVTITNGHFEQLVRKTLTGAQFEFDLPFYDDPGDNYTVIAYVAGCRQAGYGPIRLSPTKPTNLDLLLAPRHPTINFAGMDWERAKTLMPFLTSEAGDAAAQQHFEHLMEDTPKVLACMLNLVTAMRFIDMDGRSPLNYLRQVRWSPEPPAQDRFFVYCDSTLIDAVRQASAKGLFSPEYGCGVFHPGANLSWKETQLQNANLQLTFHTNPGDCIADKDWVTLEPDIDYHKDLESHAILEVCRNTLTGSLTEPAEVYMLRWMEHRQRGWPEFTPPYTLR